MVGVAFRHAFPKSSRAACETCAFALCSAAATTTSSCAAAGSTCSPGLIASEHRSATLSESLPSGIEALDALLGGGVDRFTATLLVGPAGVGKSAIATQFACAAADRGETSQMFLFEERIGTLRRRAQNLGIPLDRHVEAGTVRLHQVDPAELAPDEFTHLVRTAVEKEGARIVVIRVVPTLRRNENNRRMLRRVMLTRYSHPRLVLAALTLREFGGVAHELLQLSIEHTAIDFQDLGRPCLVPAHCG